MWVGKIYVITAAQAFFDRELNISKHQLILRVVVMSRLGVFVVLLELWHTINNSIMICTCNHMGEEITMDHTNIIKFEF